ncbi:DNA repair and recombination protein RAD54B [Entamoeba marina]
MKRSKAPSAVLRKKGICDDDISKAVKTGGLRALETLFVKGSTDSEEVSRSETPGLSMDEEGDDGRNTVVRENENPIYYWCIFKPKNKDPTPGIIEVGFDKVILFDMKAKQSGSTDITRGEIEEKIYADKENEANHVRIETQTIKIKSKFIIIDAGKLFTISNKSIKVLMEFPAEKFSNGSIFLETPPTEKQCEEIVLKKKEKKKMIFVGRVMLSKHSKNFTVPKKNAVVQRKRNTPLFDPNKPDAVVLYKPSITSRGEVAVVVDPILGEKLRPHQKEGVKFMYDCVMGLKKGYKGNGCILADGMGLGKTIQAVTLLWTLLRQGPSGIPSCKKAMVVAPSSLVGNWQNEFKKWLGDSAPRCVAVSCSGEKTDKALSDMDFGYAEILIISYDQLRIHIDVIEKIQGWGLLICDEGHRLKNAETKCSQTISRVGTPRRVILSGTPIQNDLGEFYAMVSFVNPNVLSSLSAFKNVFENHILNSRSPDATADEKLMGNQRSKELTRLTKLFILRRTSKVNQRYLPDKVQHIVFYLMKKGGKGDFYKKSALQVLTGLKKLANHPSLIVELVKTFPEALKGLLPTGPKLIDMELSGKTSFIAKLLAHLRKIRERIVIVSNYTETLYFLEKYCKKMGYPCLQLNGSVAAAKRTAMVDSFNNLDIDQFVFLLSSKAGGCGLNLVGASNLVMFDPDWNPANDEQAMGRIWQLYPLEQLKKKMYQRQVKKLELAGKVVEGGEDESSFNDKELKGLFTLKDTQCETHDLLGCTCGAGSRSKIDWSKNDGNLEVLRKEWKHYSSNSEMDDELKKKMPGDDSGDMEEDDAYDPDNDMEESDD